MAWPVPCLQAAWLFLCFMHLVACMGHCTQTVGQHFASALQEHQLLSPKHIISPTALSIGTFMASGVATAALAGSLAATGVDPAATTSLALLSSGQWQVAAPLLGGSLAAVALLRGAATHSGTSSKPLLGEAAEFASGAIFAAGLALSGMCQPSKVVG